jgi:hypothetical protein
LFFALRCAALRCVQVSYAPPLVTSIAGCAAQRAGGVVGCHRNGTSALVLRGNHFGASGATVLVGIALCAVQLQTQTEILCTVPSGTGVERGVCAVLCWLPLRRDRRQDAMSMASHMPLSVCVLAFCFSLCHRTTADCGGAKERCVHHCSVHTRL